MKTIKSILIAATLICASVVSTMSAQQAQPKHVFHLETPQHNLSRGNQDDPAP